MMLNVNLISNRHVPQNKSLSFGVSSQRLAKLMSYNNLALHILEKADGSFEGTLRKGSGEIAANCCVISANSKKPEELFSKIASSIPNGAKLQAGVFGDPQSTRTFAIA